jgi:hypothetical protein
MTLLTKTMTFTLTHGTGTVLIINARKTAPDAVASSPPRAGSRLPRGSRPVPRSPPSPLIASVEARPSKRRGETESRESRALRGARSTRRARAGDPRRAERRNTRGGNQTTRYTQPAGCRFREPARSRYSCTWRRGIMELTGGRKQPSRDSASRFSLARMHPTAPPPPRPLVPS